MTTPAYAIALLNDVDLGVEIAEYLARIDDTLTPYGGRFLVHGGPLDPREGTWSEDLVIIAFPDHAAASAWYSSPEYQAILPLRTAHSRSRAAVVDGVPAGYRAAAKLAALGLDQSASRNPSATSARTTGR